MPAPVAKETLTPAATAALERLQKRIKAAGTPLPWNIEPRRDTADQLVGWQFRDDTYLVEYVDAAAQRFPPGKRPATAAEESCFQTLRARVEAAGYTGTLTIDHVLGGDGTLAGFSFRRDGYLNEYVTPRPRPVKATR